MKVKIVVSQCSFQISNSGTKDITIAGYSFFIIFHEERVADGWSFNSIKFSNFKICNEVFLIMVLTVISGYHTKSQKIEKMNTGSKKYGDLAALHGSNTFRNQIWKRLQTR